VEAAIMNLPRYPDRNAKAAREAFDAVKVLEDD
jgi:hypothetical protein